ncbi:AAA family ATPase [Nocardioides sp. Root140]|uniref:AAA family ATPase n=1 Tax=Nocardioides sp. Root140 TaxID=1736460 RepID=UPI00138F472B|nr:AAA family ATPase [Nocardioides sp. Root140]
MAYIHSFTIDGLAGRRKPISYTLDRSLNVFWGLNGAGKTSMLKILHAALGNTSVGLAEVPFKSAQVVFWSESHRTHVRRRYEKGKHGEILVDEDGDTWELIEGQFQMMNPDIISWESDVVILNEDDLLRSTDESIDRKTVENPYRHSYLPISRMSDVSATARRAPSGLRSTVVDDSFLDEQFARHVNFRWQEYNSTALTEIRQIQQQGLAQILAILFGGVNSNDSPPADNDGSGPLLTKEMDGREAYKMVFQFLRQQGITLPVTRNEFLDSYNRDGRLQNVILSIEGTTDREQLALKPQREFSEAIGRLYSGDKILVLEPANVHNRGLRVQVGEEFIPIKSLSSGEKQLLRLMLEVLAAESNTVMIDEPELSMHPDWQLVLVDTMQKINPHCQLLLATHSPEVMTDVAGEKVFQL